MRENLNFELSNSPNQLVKKFKSSNISLYIKREDLLHSRVSGNKFRKLKYNLQEAIAMKKKTILTFGGAFSNHISAVAAAGNLIGLKTIGVIRGEELGQDLVKTIQNNETLRFAAGQGMKFIFISRERYREKGIDPFLKELEEEFDNPYIIPEGGTNALAVRGCEEILNEEDSRFDYICCPVGTGGTVSGLINSAEEHQKVLGFPALKGDFLSAEISKYTSKENWDLVRDYHFGGYGKISEELVYFINDFQKKYHIPLDPVYTGKMIFGIFDLVQKSAFPQNSHILAIHTGGLQGISGMNHFLKKKNLPLIDAYNEK